MGLAYPPRPDAGVTTKFVATSTVSNVAAIIESGITTPPTLLVCFIGHS